MQIETTAIILAAGQSARLGQPKQLVEYDGKTLLQHTIDVTKNAKVQKIIVVLGAFSERIKPTIFDLNIEIVINENWKKGMSSSLRKGLETVPNNNAVLVLLCDQPFLNTDIINKIIHQTDITDFPIIATEYDNILGVPALFKPEMLSLLNELNEQTGAKKIIRQFAKAEKVGIVAFPKGKIDVDTAADLLSIESKT